MTLKLNFCKSCSHIIGGTLVDESGYHNVEYSYTKIEEMVRGFDILKAELDAANKEIDKLRHTLLNLDLKCTGGPMCFNNID